LLHSRKWERKKSLAQARNNGVTFGKGGGTEAVLMEFLYKIEEKRRTGDGAP